MFEQGPHRQSRRDRRPRHPRLPRARRARPWPSTRRPTRAACTSRYADEAVCIGPPPAAQSYLVMPDLIMAAAHARRRRHPPRLRLPGRERRPSRACAPSNDITFIGPGPESIELMGDKAVARATMTAAGVPVTPGSDGVDRRRRRRPRRSRARIGLPVMVKASAGGGGKGIRIVHEAAALAAAVRQASGEAEAAFGNGAVYVEKYIASAAPRRDPGAGRRRGPRHPPGRARLLHPAPPPEADRGGALAGRRAPSCGRAWARPPSKPPVAAGYKGAGTVEFLLDPDGHFYFMEMNTRVQVEHCVTEMVTGIDIVKTGIRIAAGEGLPLAPGRRRRSTATPSSSASTPRTRTTTSCPRRARSPPGRRRAAPGCASTRTSTRATWCRRSTTACWASSSSGAATATRPSPARAGRSTQFRVEGVPRRSPSTCACSSTRCSWPARLDPLHRRGPRAHAGRA